MTSPFRGGPIALARPACTEPLIVVHRRRVARIVGSAVTSVIAVSAFAFACLDEGADVPVALLIASAPLGIVAGALYRIASRLIDSGRFRDAIEAERALHRVATPSLGMPLVALALSMPLTLHAVVASLVGKLDDFSEWMRLAAFFVAHVHLVLAVHGYLFARELERDPDPLASRPFSKRWPGGVAAAVAASAFPGGIFLGIPPALTLLTTLTFVPVAYAAIQHVWSRDRRIVLDELTALLDATPVGTAVHDVDTDVVPLTH